MNHRHGLYALENRQILVPVEFPTKIPRISSLSPNEFWYLVHVSVDVFEYFAQNCYVYYSSDCEKIFFWIQ
jgi:hypothetical protein